MGTRRLRAIIDEKHRFDIRVGNRLLVNLGVHLRDTLLTSTTDNAILVTDALISPASLQKARAGLSKAAFTVAEITLPSGRAAKSAPAVLKLLKQITLLDTRRGTLIVALGGEAVLDAAGFASAVYQGGLPLVRVPVTLAAMVGHTLANHAALDMGTASDRIVTDSLPVYATCDLQSLAANSRADWENGFAEIAQTALLEGGGSLEWLHNNVEGLVAHDEASLQEAIVQTLAFRALALTTNANATETCAYQSYGRPFAHALEAVALAVSAAAPTAPVASGRALAEGMRYCARLAEEVINASRELTTQQESLLTSLNLPPLLEPFDVDVLFEEMLVNAAAARDGLRVVLLAALGQPQEAVIHPDLIKIHLLEREIAKD
ncbi:MAG: hypothetical protein LBU07_01675 [Coriobacteriales bacterium]|jgi:3-dehydroquinate synthase|nr:hypothetical protein [Coriobacteriales bacterium]